MKKIGIIGTGIMGCGIAQVASQIRCEVIFLGFIHFGEFTFVGCRVSSVGRAIKNVNTRQTGPISTPFVVYKRFTEPCSGVFGYGVIFSYGGCANVL